MNTQKDRFYALDLVRFAAAFAVVLYHLTARPGGPFDNLSQFTRFGYLGVPVFFMISGFVITMSAENRSAYRFAVSRAARLYPALWVGIAFTILTCLALTDSDFEALNVLANGTLLNDYIDQPDIDGVYWTLHAELKFYACIFLLVAAGLFRHYWLWLPAWTGLALLHMLTNQPSFMGWFISPSWSPYFIAGVAMYQLQARGPSIFNVGPLTLSAGMMAAHSFGVADGFIDNPGVADRLIAASVVLSFAGLLLLVAIRRISVPASSTVFMLGALTYPLYLVHNRAGKAIIDAMPAEVPEWFAAFSAISCVVASAYVISRFIEPPAADAFKRFGHWLPAAVIPRRWLASAGN